MDANSFGLLNSLAAILNSQRLDSDYAIAHYLFEHIDTIPSISISTIIDEAFVKRSAVRRFCNRVGYRSFSEFKSHMSAAAFPSDLNHRDRSLHLDKYRLELDKRIQRLFSELSDTVSNEEIRAFARALHAHGRVVMICANNTSGVIERFQQEMFFARKFILIIAEAYLDRLVEACEDTGCMLVVVSASGVFARNLNGLLSTISSTKVLVTANPAFADLSSFDHVYRLGESPMTFDELGVFGKYGITYYFDLVSACYLELYQE